MENEKIPTVGVVARPLSSNLFLWHANIKGPPDTLYQGIILKLYLYINNIRGSFSFCISISRTISTLTS